MGKIDEGAVLLALSRAQAYRWFQLSLGSAPEGAVLAWLLKESNRGAFQAFDAASSPFSAALDAVERDIAALRVRPEARERAASAYTRLFVGPDALPVRPWESSWRGADESLFQESTLEVRRAYFAEGYVCADYPHVADDHVAIELDFLATLGMRLAQALERSDEAEARRLVASSQGFLHAHALAWMPSYAEACRALDGASYGFYVDVVQLLKNFLQLDDIALVELGGILEVRRGERAHGQGDRVSKG